MTILRPMWSIACLLPFFSVRSRRFPAETITDANYAADQTLFTNTPAPAECLQRWPLHELG